MLSGGESSRFIPSSQLSSLRQASSKTSLLSRFLRSITERKFELKKDNKKTLTKLNNALSIKRGKIDPATVKEVTDEVEKEMKEISSLRRKEIGGEKISPKLKEILKRNIYRDKTEELYKVYKVRSSYMTNGESKPMLALLTDKTLYLTGQKGSYAYSNQFVIPYNELDVIMVRVVIGKKSFFILFNFSNLSFVLQIGPNAQTILISNADYEMQYLFSTGSSFTTSELISHLEIAMRRSPSKPRLPAVKELNYDDMHVLKHSILSDTAIHMVILIIFFYIYKTF